MRRRPAAMIAVALVLSVGALGACGGGDDDGDGTSSGPTKATAGFLKDMALPDGFPEDEVPVPDAQLLLGSATEERGAKGFALQFRTPNLGEATKAYHDRLKEAGFDSEGLSTGDAGGVEYSGFNAHDDHWAIVVVGTSAGGDPALTVTITEADTEASGG